MTCKVIQFHFDFESKEQLDTAWEYCWWWCDIQNIVCSVAYKWHFKRNPQLRARKVHSKNFHPKKWVIILHWQCECLKFPSNLFKNKKMFPSDCIHHSSSLFLLVYIATQFAYCENWRKKNPRFSLAFDQVYYEMFFRSFVSLHFQATVSMFWKMNANRMNTSVEIFRKV